MPRIPLHLHTPEDKERRDRIWDGLLRFLPHIRGSEEAARNAFPKLVENAEDQIVAYVTGLPRTDEVGRLYQDGRLSREYVHWLVNQTLFRSIFGLDGSPDERVKATYMQYFPEPDPTKAPYDDWLPRPTKETEDDAGADADASRNANVGSESDSASSSKEVDPAPASVTQTDVQEAPSTTTPARPVHDTASFFDIVLHP
ncbi:hypothetical protein PG991_008478 [Apiospora marii]|uniref:Uncharacterized protein n=1 Tax=Apiospora marii TaxID=335849 RepID=A0ABR1RM57_9PEZI